MGKGDGVEVSCDFLNWPDLRPKIAASVQASGYDIVELWGGWNYLYKDNLVEVSDIAEPFGKRNGGWERYVELSYKVGDRCLGAPHGYSNGSMAYRISWFKEAGCPNAEDGNKIDLTWERVLRHRQEVESKRETFRAGPRPQYRRSSGRLLSVHVVLWSHGSGKGRQDHNPQ